MSKQEVIEIRRVDKVIDGIMDKVCAVYLSLIMYVYARVLI